MHLAQDAVSCFKRKIGGHVLPHTAEKIGFRDAELNARLIAEEAAETVVAAVGRAKAGEILREFAEAAATVGDESPSVPMTVDGICDLIYVAYGMAEAIGVDLEPFFNEVHRTNMLKTDAAVDAHGKRGGKPAGWEPPRIEAMLKKLGWRP